MTGKFLGKITSAEYGIDNDRDWLMGLHLTFTFDSCGICSGSKYTVNMTKDKYRQFTQEEQNANIVENVENVYDLLQKAKCKYVSQLKNKPVEIEIENNLFKCFRILIEVL